MSSEAIGWVYRHSPHTGLTFAVHLAIADSVNDQFSNEFWMSSTALAKKVRATRSRVSEAVAQLVESEHLETLDDRPGKTNRYRFLFPETAAVVYNTRPKPVPVENTPKAPDLFPVVTPPVPIENTHLFPQRTTPVPSENTIPIEPKVKPKGNPNSLAIASPRKRDLLFEALIAELQISPEALTESGRGSINKALQELRSVGATPVEVRRRCHFYRQLYPESSLTAPALAKHWAQLHGRQRPRTESKNRRALRAVMEERGVV